MRLRAGILLSAIVGSALPFVLVVGAADAGIVCNTVHTQATCDLEDDLNEPSPPPANDNFAAATVVTGFPKTATGTTTSATVEQDEPAMCSPSSATVWYKWTSDADRSVAVDTFLGGTNTVLAVYTGSTLSNLAEVGCNDDTSTAGGPTTASEVNFSAVSGTTYYIQVGYSQGNGRSVTLHITVPRQPAPSNDDYQSATTVDSLPYAATQDTRGATRGAEDDLVCGLMLGTVWYKFTPTEDALISADTAGSSLAGNPMAGALAVLRDNGDLVACNFDVLTGKGTISTAAATPLFEQPYDVTAVYQPPGAPVVFLAEAGTTYYIQVGGAFGGSGDQHKLNVKAVG